MPRSLERVGSLPVRNWAVGRDHRLSSVSGSPVPDPAHFSAPTQVQPTPFLEVDLVSNRSLVPEPFVITRIRIVSTRDMPVAEAAGASCCVPAAPSLLPPAAERALALPPIPPSFRYGSALPIPARAAASAQHEVEYEVAVFRDLDPTNYAHVPRGRSAIFRIV